MAGGGLDLRAAATTAVAVVIEFGGRELIVEGSGGRQELGGFVVGPSMAATRVRARRAECVEVRMSPIRAYSLLGVAANELGLGVVPAEQLWGSRVRRLREQLADVATWEERFALTGTFLARCERPMRAPDPEVIAAWQRILGSGGQVNVGDLAASVGWSRKRLWARFDTQIGVTPKRAAMLVRFRRAVAGLLAGRPGAAGGGGGGGGRVGGGWGGRGGGGGRPPPPPTSRRCAGTPIRRICAETWRSSPNAHRGRCTRAICPASPWIGTGPREHFSNPRGDRSVDSGVRLGCGRRAERTPT